MGACDNDVVDTKTISKKDLYGPYLIQHYEKNKSKEANRSQNQIKLESSTKCHITSFFLTWGKSNLQYQTGNEENYEGTDHNVKKHCRSGQRRETATERTIRTVVGLTTGLKNCGIIGIENLIGNLDLGYRLNNNEYQITRGKELNRIARVDKTCDFVKADFMKMPFPENSFDVVYAFQVTCHAPDAYGCYSEIYRVLKRGQRFAAYEWCMTDSFDPKNKKHQRIKAEIEIGDGLPDIRLTGQCLEALKKAGFEIIWSEDLAASSPLPWYLPLDKNHFSFSSFRLTAVGRFFTKICNLRLFNFQRSLFNFQFVKALEYVGIAPKGSLRVQDFLEKAAEGIVEGGSTQIYFFFRPTPY
ncbi:hypothetical protein K2173_012362 [Erythroxylum novogranatense]|uniref:Methyltransferase n=1 Tax=Erythroxylum novogranatense TaxID=1862640 RepID=A0AAV8UED8_9ROSI|nr:hypothetical protein K2173_012362 [Erythroxylum novogranatense]